MTRVEVEEGAGNGGPNEQADSGNAEAHTEAGADLAQVSRERGVRARGQRDERAGEEAVQSCECD